MEHYLYICSVVDEEIMLRPGFKGIQYRLLAFWDTDAETYVVATHGFIKKTQKTPRKEINKAETIRRIYFETKK